MLLLLCFYYLKRAISNRQDDTTRLCPKFWIRKEFHKLELYGLTSFGFKSDPNPELASFNRLPYSVSTLTMEDFEILIQIQYSCLKVKSISRIHSCFL